MKTKELITKLQEYKKDTISIKEVFKLYNLKHHTLFMEDLKNCIEDVFNIDDLRKKCRKQKYIVARSCFCYLSKMYGISLTEYSKFLNIHHATCSNSIIQFETYQRYYDEYKQSIAKVLIWYTEKTKSE